MIADRHPNSEPVALRRIPAVDRRKHRRLVLAWPLKLCGNGVVVHTHTVNISSAGFFCLSSCPFSSGQNIIGLLEFPEFSSAAGYTRMLLRWEATVVRVETIIGRHEYGIAFRITDYSVVTSSRAN